jgi:ornithine carbamoyltransferase
MMKAKRDFLTLSDFTPNEIYELLSLAEEMKSRGGPSGGAPLAGKSVAMIFKKPSTRTRVSFDVAIDKLGGHSIYLPGNELQMGRGETVEDTGQVLSRYVDAVVIRTGAHAEAVDLAAGATVPVVNALTDNFHPCQALADLLTILEKRSRFSGVKLAYIGDGNNVCNSLMVAAAKMGLDFAAACPAGYEPRAEIMAAVEADRVKKNTIAVTNDPTAAVAGADFLYTDVWTSMGQDSESDERRRRFAGFQIDPELLSSAKPDALVMHCLPAHRGEEIASEVMDGPKSIVFDQAENRLHAQMALLAWLMEKC